MTPPREILIIKPSSLGDVVHTLPAVALIKRHWPDAHLRWLINPEWAPLLDDNPQVDEIVIFPRGEFRGPHGWAKVLGWAKALRGSAKSDLVLDFQGLLRSALIGKFCRAKDGRVIGLSDAREGARFFYDHVVDVSEKRHAVDRYLALVAALGIETGGMLEWPLPAGTAPVGFDPAQRFVLVHPLSRGDGKSLSCIDVVGFTNALSPRRVVVAGRGDLPVVDDAHVTDLLNRTTLAELIWLIRNADFIVSVDSGPMHIAAALTPRLVSIHTWSDPAKVGPYQPEAWVWQVPDETLVQMRHLHDVAARRCCPDFAALAAFVATQL